MKNNSETIGIEKIIFYPQELYALHYKGQPFSVSNISIEEQRKLGISYPSKGTITRKCYFTEGHAKTGAKLLPKSIRDKIEIVRYVPVNDEKNKKIIKILEEHCNNCPCKDDCKEHRLDDMNCVIDDIINTLNNFNIK